MNSFQHAASAELVISGDPFFEKLEQIIDAATEVIHLQTYIFEEDATGSTIITALERAVARGVKVFVLTDAYGSKSLSKKFIAAVNAAGIHFRLFSPFFSSESIYMGRRLHHKLVVVDKTTALIGGINIAGKYQGSAEEAAWLDYAVLIRGNVCTPLHTLCELIYYRQNFKRIRQRKLQASADQNGVLVRFTRNDWIRGKNEIYKSYLQLLNTAKKEVVFVTSYFLPGYRFRKAMKNARKRGVKITIVLAGKSDMPLLFFAEKYLYPFFLKNGIEIYEWKKSTMHAKIMIADRQLSTIGSYNLNPLSRYRSIELNAEVSDAAFSGNFNAQVETMMRTDCVKVTFTKNSHAAGRWAKIRNYIFYYFFKLFFAVFISRKSS